MQNNIKLHFGSVKDPRINRKKLHSFEDILMLVIIALICGADSWDSIEDFGKARKQWLKTFLGLENGIPSHDTINRVFSSIDPEQFSAAFISWVESLKNKNITREVIAIDGKTVRGSKDSFHQIKAVHIVSAWACKNQLVLGQFKINEKSNEITAIPELLDLLDIEGNIITIDAMGTQIEIAKKIIDNGADYILALKGNQSNFHEEVESIFKVQKAKDTNCVTEKNRGRIERRTCEVISDLTFLEGKEKWEGIKSIVRIISEREIGGVKSVEARLYISSLDVSAEEFNQYIRSHWGIENSLHWTLDIIFNEDRQRKRNKNAAQNFALVQKIVLNILKSDNTKNKSIKAKRLIASWDNEYLFKLLGF